MNTKCFPKEVIEKATSSRKSGYLEEVKKRNSSTDPEKYCLEEEDVNYIRDNFRKVAMPSIVQMAKNATEAAIAETKAIATGKEPASKEEITRRLSICDTCEFFTPNIPELSEDKKKQKRCVKCGCFMNFKAKLRSSNCPIGRW